MNTRCVPLLAFVIWYLLTPPNIGSHPSPQSGPQFFSTTPFPAQQSKRSPALSTWHPLAEFDSEEQCDQARTRAIGDTERTVEKYEALLNSARRDSDQQEESAGPDLRSRLDRLREYYKSLISARCIADDCPGLYDK